MNSLRVYTFVFACCLLSGCEQSVEEVELPPARENLEVLGSGYSAYVVEMGRAPSSLESLKPILEQWGEDSQSIGTSPRDSQEYVVVWGVDLANVEIREDSTPIIAYEKTGDGKGNRFVTNGRETYEVSDEDFRSLYFPAGYTP